ncbi:hypothetical protein DFH06DRAFT_468657 [Mycena polygramma]|nr:hypothetical protein DFH06DRAFT_468657 [Mycena polygramma]
MNGGQLKPEEWERKVSCLLGLEDSEPWPGPQHSRNWIVTLIRHSRNCAPMRLRNVCLKLSAPCSFGEITLQEGNVVQAGQSLKGRVAVRQIKDGSTVMSDISISLEILTRNRWAQAEALAGGDTKLQNVTHGVCAQSSGDSLDTEARHFLHIFNEKEDDWMLHNTGIKAYADGTLTPAQPYLDFELHIPRETPVDFASYYSNPENYLHFRLAVMYSPEIAQCVWPGMVDLSEEETIGDDAVKMEEGLWNSYTPVGAPIGSSSAIWGRAVILHALVPITVVSGVPASRDIAHYLEPGSPAPVLRSGVHTDMPVSFPVVEPVLTMEALANTSPRLMQPGTTDPAQRRAQFRNISRSWSSNPDPTRDYRGGDFAGLLWKKKMVAEQRGILSLPSEAVDSDGDAQKSFLAS